MQAPLQAKNDSNAAKADVARTVAQKRVFADNGPEAMAQHQLAEMINNSPRVLQQRALSDAIHNSTRMVAQRHEMNVLFGGAVRPHNANGGVSVNVDAALEAEADVMGSKALRSNAGNSIENIQLAAHTHAALPSCAVAQLYAHAAYVPNLAELEVPGGGGAAYNVATFARPAGWYEGTHDALFARAVDDGRTEENPRLAITLAQCESAGSWHNVNDMQIGHIENWQTYLTFVGPQTIREATDAYNDLNNLRLEGPTANTSHDFENGRESEDEDDSSDDDFIDKSDEGKMHPDARRGLDEYKASQSQYHSLKAGR